MSEIHVVSSIESYFKVYRSILCDPMIKYHKVWEKKGKTLKGRDRWSNKVTQKKGHG